MYGLLWLQYNNMPFASKVCWAWANWIQLQARAADGGTLTHKIDVSNSVQYYIKGHN